MIIWDDAKPDPYSKSVFDSVIMSAFQITFRVKIHVNNVFLVF